MNGLIDFLKKLKKLVPANLYTIAETGFFSFYFTRGCWLRQKLGPNPKLKSEEQIRQMLTIS